MKNLRLLITTLVAICTFQSIYAQETTSISGTVTDSASQKAIEFVTVGLANLEDDKIVGGEVTDINGKFTIREVPKGTYKLVFRFIGYQDFSISPIEVDGSKQNIDVGSVQLAISAEALDEVEIVSQAELFEDQGDKIVYNAEKDPTNAGGTAADVLRKAPLLSVDLDGNVQMRGSSNIVVLINNRPSSIMANSVADALRQIPADNIAKVEVITNPPARYDAEGTAGIINIITKKDKMEGVNGSVNAGAGNQNSNLGLSLNGVKDKFAANGYIGAWGSYNRPFESENNRTNFLDEITFLNQKGEGQSYGMSYYGNLGLSYEFNKKNIVNVGGRYNSGQWNSTNDLNTLFTNESGEIIQNFARDIDNESVYGNFNINADYIRSFDNPKKEFSMGVVWSREIRNSAYELDQTQLANNLIDYRENNINDSFNNEITVQADFSQPLDSSFTLEMGAKSILRMVESDYQFSSATGLEEPFVNNPALSNVFNYDQDVYASYLSLSYATKKKFRIRLGARYEYTDIDADFISTQTSFTQDYDNLIPSVFVSQGLKNGHQVKASYSRRIARPMLYFLNPYVNISDAKNISFGNPNLQPELTDNYEVGYTAFIKTLNISANLFLRDTRDVITSVRSVNSEGVNITTYENIATNQSYGMDFFASWNFKKLRLNAGGSLFNTDFNNPDTQEKNSALMFNINGGVSYQFPKNFSFQSWVYYGSPSAQLQGTNGGWLWYDGGIKKTFWGERGSLTFSAQNFLSAFWNWQSDFQTDTFDATSNSRNFNRSFRLNFNYRFGKIDMKQRPRKTKNISNDDTKGGSDNSGGGTGR